MSKKIKQLHKALDLEIQKAEKRMQMNKQAANEISRSAAGSPSQSGDREHATNQYHLARQVHVTLLKIAENLKKQKIVSSEKINIPSCVQIYFEDEDESRQLFLLDEAFNIKGFTIVSANSDLGKALVGRKLGEKFAYKTPAGEKKGKIINFE